MMFDLLCVFLIYRRGKWQTRRKYTPGRRPAVPGHTHKIKIDRTPDVYGYIEIEKVYPQKFGDITLFEATAEGFTSVHEYKEYFQKVNGPHEDDDLIWVVTFRKLDFMDVKVKDAINKKLMELIK